MKTQEFEIFRQKKKFKIWGIFFGMNSGNFGTFCPGRLSGVCAAPSSVLPGNIPAPGGGEKTVRDGKKIPKTPPQNPEVSPQNPDFFPY